MIVYTSNGTTITLDDTPLGSGGSGSVYKIIYPVHGSVAHCVKLYKDNFRTDEQHKKILHQIQNQPKNIINNGKFVLCWPIDWVSINGKFAGFVMPLAFNDSGSMKTISMGVVPRQAPQNIQNAYNRVTLDGAINRLGVCVNLAAALHNIHEAGYVLIDLKPENFYITADRKVSVLDLDNIQIAQNKKVLFNGGLATLDYQPVEGFTGKANPAKDYIDPSWDRFSLAVVYYQVLFGIHPYTATFQGKYENDTSHPIKNGLYVHGSKKQYVKVALPHHNGLTKAPMNIQSLFLKAFDLGHSIPSKRPSAEEFGKVFYEEYERLKKNSISKINTGLSNPYSSPINSATSQTINLTGNHNSNNTTNPSSSVNNQSSNHVPIGTKIFQSGDTSDNTIWGWIALIVVIIIAVIVLFMNFWWFRAIVFFLIPFALISTKIFQWVSDKISVGIAIASLFISIFLSGMVNAKFFDTKKAGAITKQVIATEVNATDANATEANATEVNDTDSTFDEAKALFQNKKYNASFEQFKQIPDDPKSYSYLGYLYSRNNDYENAKYYDAKSCDNGESAGCFNLGNVRQKNLEYSLALEAYKKADKLGDIDANCRIANIYFDYTQIDKAREYIAKDSGNGDANLCDIEGIKTKVTKYEETKSAFESYLKSGCFANIDEVSNYYASDVSHAFKVNTPSHQYLYEDNVKYCERWSNGMNYNLESFKVVNYYDNEVDIEAIINYEVSNDVKTLNGRGQDVVRYKKENGIWKIYSIRFKKL